MSGSIPPPFQPGGGGSWEKPRKSTVVLTRIMYLVVGGALSGGLVQALFGVVLLSASAAAVFAGVCVAWNLRRFLTRPRDVELGSLARFLSSDLGRRLLLVAMWLALVGLLALNVYSMATCPRAGEGLC